MIIEINTQSVIPIYEQLCDQIVLGIASKKLFPGESLPSTRNLAADLGINSLTVNKAYSILCDDGYIVMDRRKGAIVTRNMAVNETFLSGLKQKLLLSAAEGICRGMSETDYTALCAKCYKDASGDPEKGEK